MDRTVITPQGDTDLRQPIVDERPLARIQAVPWLIVIVLLAAVAWLGWRAFFYSEEGDPVGSAMLAFEKQNSLNVFSSRFEILAESVYRRKVGPITVNSVRQASITPATVEYKLNLGDVGRDNFAWNAETETLTVTVPQLQIGDPNIDERYARSFTDGVFNTGGSQQELAKNNARQSVERAKEFAKNPQVLSLARQSAKEAVRQNLAIPLQVAGYENAKVVVRFEGEKAAN